MKFRIAAFAAVALAAITLLAGCNKGASNTNGANSNSTSNAGPVTSPTAKPTATTSDGAGGTPTDAFKAYFEAIKNKDTAAAKALFPKPTLKALEDQAKATNKSADDVFKEGLESASKEVPATLPE